MGPTCPVRLTSDRPLETRQTRTTRSAPPVASSRPPTLIATAVVGAPWSTSCTTSPVRRSMRRTVEPADRTAARAAPRERTAPRASAIPGTTRVTPSETSRRRPSLPVSRTWPPAEIDASSAGSPVATARLDPRPLTSTLPSPAAVTTRPSTTAAASNGLPTSITVRTREAPSACRRTSSAVGVGDSTAESRASSRPSSGSVGRSETAIASSSRACASRASDRALLRWTSANTAISAVIKRPAIAAEATRASLRLRRCAATSACAWTYRARHARIGAARTSW